MTVDRSQSPTLTDRSLVALLDAFASSDPTPGGGSAAALAGAVGASLLAMVARLPRTRGDSDEDRDALRSASDALPALRDRLTDLIDRDSEAYNLVVAAYRLPKATDEENASRTARVQQALRRATEVPLEVMRACAQALDQAVIVARHGHQAAASDVGVALALLGAGLHGAALNVKTNLEGLRDQAYVAAVHDEAARLEHAASDTTAAAQAHVAGGRS